MWEGSDIGEDIEGRLRRLGLGWEIGAYESEVVLRKVY